MEKVYKNWMFRHRFCSESTRFAIWIYWRCIKMYKINEEKRKIYSSLVRIIGSDASEWQTKTNIKIIVGFSITKRRTCV